MNPLLQRLMARLQAPAGDDGSVVDRGDDFTPTGDDAPGATPKDDDKGDNALRNGADADDDKGDDKDDEEEKKGKDEKAKKPDSRIPLSRHKEILERERAQRQELERRLAEAQKGSEAVKVSEEVTKLEDKVLGLEEAYNKAITDGETQKATQLMREIRQAEREIGEAKSEMRARVAEANAYERARYSITLERVEETYPELNPDHDDYDKAKVDDVAEWKMFYESRKAMTPAKALQEAVKKVMGAPTTRAEKTAVETKARVDEKDVAAERKKEAVKKATDAVGKTPAGLNKVGMDSDKAGGDISAKDVLKMSQEDFAKLPDEVLARMRGDML